MRSPDSPSVASEPKTASPRLLSRLAGTNKTVRNLLALALVYVAPQAPGCNGCSPAPTPHDARPAAHAPAPDLPADHASGKEEHMTHHAHPDMKAQYAKESAHPFHLDPETWLNEHQKEVETCFAPTGQRIVRVPGSGVLKDQDAWAADLARQAKEMERKTGKPVKVIIEAHDACGAAGIAYKGEDKPDDRARDFDRTLVAKLRAKGVDAEYGGDSAMNGLPVHTALASTIDFTGGRMQSPPINSFAAASPDLAGIADDALLALNIAAGDHSYGKELKQFTFLAFIDPAHRTDAESVLREIEEKAKPFRAKGIDVRIVRRDAPKPDAGDAVSVLRVQCIDERVQRKH